MIQKRDSAIEMLRIVAMSMILIYHFFFHVLDVDQTQGLAMAPIMLVIAGVNIFVMISGYFGIKLRWRGVLSLGITVLFFNIVNVIMCMVCGVSIPLRSIIMTVIFPFSSTPYWFIQVYIVLMITAPLINMGLMHMNSVQLRTTVALLAFVSIWCGHIGGNMVNPGGYNYLQFVFMYVAGYFIRAEHECLSRWKRWSLPVFFIMSIISVALFAVGKHYNILWNRLLHYNSISVVVASVALVVYFSNLKFSSSAINKLASCALGCYMLQDGFFGEYVYKWQQHFISAHDPFCSMGMFASTFVAIWTLSFCLTQFKNLWAPWLVDRIMTWIPLRLKREVW